MVGLTGIAKNHSEHVVIIFGQIKLRVRMPEGLPMLMDRAYEGDEMRQLVLDLGMVPVVPPKSNRIEPWEYDRALYKKRNEIERLFRRLKGFRRIFSRFEKLDVLFIGFLNLALIIEALR
jgi:transposase